MKNPIQKIERRFWKAREFGLFFTLAEEMQFIFEKKFKTKGYSWIKQKVDRQKLRFIREEGKDIFDFWRNEISRAPERLEKDAPMWIFWWQGIEEAPQLVRLCIASLRRWSNGHPVHILTKYNLEDFLNLPSYLYQKLDKGIIGYAHFADIVRVALLYQYGGIWCDATLYAADDFLKMAEGMPLFSCRQRHLSGFLSEGRWATFFWASGKNNPVFGLCCDFLLNYWEKHNVILDYLLPDYILTEAYICVPQIRMLIDQIPYNNESLYWMQKNINEYWDADEYKRVTQKNPLFKLTYKVPLFIDKNGKKTLYGWLNENEWG